MGNGQSGQIQDPTKEHWTLYLVDTYILYKVFSIIVIIVISARGKGGWEYLWYKIFPDFSLREFNRWRSAKEWSVEKNAQQQMGGANSYSIRTWFIFLLFSIFTFLIAILFPKKTKETLIGSVTSPNMFNNSILDSEQSDHDKLWSIAQGGALFGKKAPLLNIDQSLMSLNLKTNSSIF